MVNHKIHIGIGFATGRSSFQNVLKSYIYHLKESEFLSNNHLILSLFVAYDTTYSNTTLNSYTNIPEEIRQQFYQCHFIGKEDIESEAQRMYDAGIITQEESSFCFGYGYAAQRNSILYRAMQENVDYLIFLDDDEYPLAVTKSGDTCLWSGQHVIENHVRYLQFSDITNGYHCGYVSPLPLLEFDGILAPSVFRSFIEALSSDVLSWDSVLETISNGGVTYADKDVLVKHQVSLVPEEHNARFITGGNLGLNLTQREKVLPFYNPPGARGEDSFLSTCLHNHTVKRIPTYTFHDGFSIYGTLLNGVLPTSLKAISYTDSASIIKRFYRTAIGWVRYKPLFTYLTQPNDYTQIMENTHQSLEQSIPMVCAYFNNKKFALILDEFLKFKNAVPEHSDDFERLKLVWEKLKTALPS